MPTVRLGHLNTERWKRIEAILDEALEMPAERVRAYIKHACGEDRELLAAVDALLEADAAAEAFLERPAIEGMAGLLETDSEEGPERSMAGRRIGPWRVTSEIGRGGMGSVYLAERSDADFEQRVALKLIRRGLDTHDILRRFVRERRILARLEHRHIGRLVDGGVTDDGLPWFAMEYVEGLPITEWCDRHHADLPERLCLFRAVCDAVRHAHRNLVVHRDLKPSNIFVSSDGEVKLLDFGIARLLEDDNADAATRTGAGRRLLTPQYAAPEQLRGEEASTAADIYSLGAVLYELLSGSRAREAAPPEDALGGALERDPAPPSARKRSWRKLLQGDLDNIALMALRAEPQRRYPSVEALLSDLERYDQGLPVQATPPSLRYKARRFLRRHRTGAVGAGFVIATVAAGLIVMLWQTVAVVIVLAILAAALAVSAWQTRLARLEVAKAGEVRSFLMRVFEVSDPSVARGSSVTAREILDRGAQRIDMELRGQPALRAEMLGVLADLYLKLGLHEPALPLIEREIDLLSGARKAKPGRRGDAERRRGNVLLLKGDWSAAEAVFRAAAALHRTSFGEASAAYAEDLDQLAAALRPQAKIREAAESVSRSLEIRKTLFGPDHPEVAVSLNNLALMMREEGRLRDAESSYRESLRIRRMTLGGDHPDVASTLNNFAVLLRQMGRFGEAVAAARDALAIQTRLYGGESAITIASEATLGALLQNLGRYEEAETLQRKVLAYWDAHAGREHPNAIASLNNLAAVLREKGDLVEAEPLQRETVERWRRLVGDGHPYYAYGIVNLAAILRETGAFDEARDLLDQAERIRRRLHGDEHPETATILWNQALLADREGRLPEAERLHGEALALREKLLGARNPSTAVSRAGLASTLRRRGALGGAERHLRAAAEILAGSLPEDHPELAAVALELGRTLRDQGREEEALGAFREARRVRALSFGAGSQRTIEVEQEIGRTKR